MKVYVVMGNDFPDSVWTNEKEAEAYCQECEARDGKRPGGVTRIYWRVYGFKVRGDTIEFAPGMTIRDAP